MLKREKIISLLIRGDEYKQKWYYSGMWYGFLKDDLGTCVSADPMTTKIHSRNTSKCSSS